VKKIGYVKPSVNLKYLAKYGTFYRITYLRHYTHSRIYIYANNEHVSAKISIRIPARQYHFVSETCCTCATNDV